MQTAVNISQYTQLDAVIDSIYVNINRLTDIHQTLLDDTTNTNNIHEYTIYIDDLHFQRSILTREVDHLLLLKQLSIRRFYASLFRLYQHVTQNYAEVIKDRYIGGFGSPEHMRIFYYEPRIRLYNEIDVITLYSYSDIEMISSNLVFYLNQLKGQLNQMHLDIHDLEIKMSKGYHVNSILSAYRNEHIKYTNNVNTFSQLFTSIHTMNLGVVQRFIDRSIIIRDEIHETSVQSSNSSTNESNDNSHSVDMGIKNEMKIEMEMENKLKIDIPPSADIPNITMVVSKDDDSYDNNYDGHGDHDDNNEVESSIEKAMTELIQENMNGATKNHPYSTDDIPDEPSE
jgi:hypothetical protein